jgi:type IV pilus assembly protein PilN
MARINLLPWRDELRQQRQKEFFTSIGLSALLTVCILGFVHMYIDGLITHQESRNKLLKDEIAELDKKIREIKDIE